MSKGSKKITVWFLLFATSGLVLVKAYQLSKISFALDDRDKQLADVKKAIQPGATIDYYSNTNSSSDFVETSFAMAPALLVNNLSRDTILAIQSKAKGLKQFGGYKILLQNENGDLVTTLLKSNK